MFVWKGSILVTAALFHFHRATVFSLRFSLLHMSTSSSSSGDEGVSRYDRPGFRQMKPDHYELLLKTERETGAKLSQIDDMSAGCLVANVNNKKELRLLLAQSLNGNWGIPKGHPNEGETPIEAALREVQEEVGVRLQLSSLLNSAGEPTYAENCYIFVDKLHKDAWQRHPDYPDTNKRPICIVYKTVRYYLAFIESDRLEEEITVQEEEVARAEWLLLEDAFARFTFADDQNVVAQLMNSAFMHDKIGTL